jgi:EpsI family protein
VNLRLRLRLLAVTLALLAPLLVLALWTPSVLPEGAVAPAVALPESVGEWNAAEDQILEEWVLEIAAPDSYQMRLYRAPERNPIWVYVGMYAGRAGYTGVVHSPEGCYPAAGWEIVGSHFVHVTIGERQALDAKRLDVQQGNAEEAVLYWFQPAERWPSKGISEQVWTAVDSVRGRPQFAFVRLSGPAGATAERDLVEFAGLAAPAIRAAVERMGSEMDMGTGRPRVARTDP